MSRTYHHSRKHGKSSRWATRPDRKPYSNSRDSSEARNAWSHRCDIVPGRLADRRVMKKLLVIPELFDELTMPYTGTRRPHTWDW